MSSPAQTSPTSARTRRAIVDAAVEVYAADRNAALAAVAQAAGVSRSTLHRHVADRAELIGLIDTECRQRFAAAAAAARPDAGTGIDALERLGLEYLDLGSVLGLVFADNALVDPDSWTGGDTDTDPSATIVARGLTDGSVAADLPVDWVVTTLWVLLFGAWLSRTDDSVGRDRVRRLFARTLRGAVSTRAAAAG